MWDGYFLFIKLLKNDNDIDHQLPEWELVTAMKIETSKHCILVIFC